MCGVRTDLECTVATVTKGDGASEAKGQFHANWAIFICRGRLCNTTESPAKAI